MSLVRWRRISLSLEDMAKMTPAIAAHNLRPLHAKTFVRVSCHCAWDGIEIGGPATARLELLRRFVQGGIAGGAGIHALRRVVRVIFPRAGALGAFLAEDTELLCSSQLAFACIRLDPGWSIEVMGHEPGLRTARHSSSLRWSG